MAKPEIIFARVRKYDILLDYQKAEKFSLMDPEKCDIRVTIGALRKLRMFSEGCMTINLAFWTMFPHFKFAAQAHLCVTRKDTFVITVDSQEMKGVVNMFLDETNCYTKLKELEDKLLMIWAIARLNSEAVGIIPPPRRISRLIRTINK